MDSGFDSFSWQRANFRRLDSRVIQFERVHNCKVEATYIDAFGPSCHLFVCQNPPKGLGISHLGRVHFHSGPVAMFLPPFSIVQWHLPVGGFNWTGYLLDKNPDHFPQEPLFFPWEINWTIEGFKSLEKVFSLDIGGVPGGKEDIVIGQARRAKNYIDQTFTEDLSLEKIAKAIGTSRPSLTRSFRLSFGLSPIEYRNRVRVFDSIRKMLVESAQVTQVSYDSGFNDYSNYTRKFKQIVGEKPSVFRWQKDFSEI